VRFIDPRLFRHSRNSRGYLVAALGVALLTAVLSLAQAALITTLIVKIFHLRPASSTVTPLLWQLLAVFAARSVLAFAGEQIAVRAGNRVRAELRSRLLNRLLADAEVVNRFGSAHISMLATRGINALDAYFAKYIPQLFIAMTVPLLVGAYIFHLDTTSGVLLVVTVPLIPILGALIGSYTGKAMEKKWRTLGLLSGYFLDLVSGLTTLKVFGRSRLQEENLERVGEQYRSNTMKVLRISFLSALALEIVATLSVAVIAVSIGLRLVTASIDLRTGLLILILAPEVYWPLRMVGSHFHAAADGIETANQIFEVLDAPQMVNGSIQVNAISAIEISHLEVRLGTRETKVVIPATRIERGRVIAVTGPSGAGKSTLLSLLLGFTRLNSGTIRIEADGQLHDLQELDLNSWRTHISWVPQRPRLPHGTLRELVRLGDAHASDTEIASALVKAGLPLSTFREGLDSTIGEGGAGISIGQSRRIALARALIRRADLLLLDEPSAALDDLSEAEIVAAVQDEAERGAIVLVVSHHPALIEISHETITIEKPVEEVDEVQSATR